MNRIIQTDLLGTRVIIESATGLSYGPDNETENKEGRIRNVYYDVNGDIKYTIQVMEIGRLIELYACHFRISNS